MTQKEKITRAVVFARRVKSLATRLEYEANEYDTKWPNKYVSELLITAEEILKQLQSK